MLALVWAARHFWPYLYGRQFLARTDHCSLCWLHNFKEPEGQVACWLEILSLTIGWSTALECSMLMQIHSVEVSVGSVVNLQTPALKEMLASPYLPLHYYQRGVWRRSEICRWKKSWANLSLGCNARASRDNSPTSVTPKLQMFWNQWRQLTLVDGVLRWEDVQGSGTHKRLQLVFPASLMPKSWLVYTTPLLVAIWE